MTLESSVTNIASIDISQILNDFTNIAGVEAVALVGRDGFVIASSSEQQLNIDALGAMVATSVESAESLGRELGLGSMDQYLSEFSNGKVIMCPVKDDILAVFANKEVVIGSMRYAISKELPRLASILY